MIIINSGSLSHHNHHHNDHKCVHSTDSGETRGSVLKKRLDLNNPIYSSSFSSFIIINSIISNSININIGNTN